MHALRAYFFALFLLPFALCPNGHRHGTTSPMPSRITFGEVRAKVKQWHVIRDTCCPLPERARHYVWQYF